MAMKEIRRLKTITFWSEFLDGLEQLCSSFRLTHVLFCRRPGKTSKVLIHGLQPDDRYQHITTQGVQGQADLARDLLRPVTLAMERTSDFLTT